MFESEISHNLIKPQIFISYSYEEPESFIQKLDFVLVEMGPTATTVAASKLIIDTAEGSIIDGVTGGPDASKKNETLSYIDRCSNGRCCSESTGRMRSSTCSD